MFKIRFRTFLAKEGMCSIFSLICFQDIKNWEPKRFGLLVVYIFVTIFSGVSVYKAIRGPIVEREKRELTEAYMDALIPEPTPTNVRK